MKSQGNTSAGGSTDRSRPLPRADDGKRSTHTHQRREKPAGLDFAALAPKCTSCGQKRGDVDTSTGLCPTCAGPGGGGVVERPVVPEPLPDPVDIDEPDEDLEVDDDLDLDQAVDQHDGDVDEAVTVDQAGDVERIDPPGRGQELLEVLVDELHPDPDNPRERLTEIEDLAASMRSAGLLQPIVVRRDDTGRLVVVAGHRRLAAAQHLGWTRVAVVVRRGMRADEVLAAMLIENGQRAGLDPIEEARALSRVKQDRKLGTDTLLAELVGRSLPHVTGRLALLALGADDQDAVRAGRISIAAATSKARVDAGRTRPTAVGKKSAQHLSIHHNLARNAAARCQRLAHKAKGAASVGGMACGECWESVIRADERTHLNAVSNERGRCVLCDTTRDVS